jgi:hypothetical protein
VDLEEELDFTALSKVDCVPFECKDKDGLCSRPFTDLVS